MSQTWWPFKLGFGEAAAVSPTTASTDSTSCAPLALEICEPCIPAATVSRLQLYGHLQHHPALNAKAQITFAAHAYAIYHETDYEAVLLGAAVVRTCLHIHCRTTTRGRHCERHHLFARQLCGAHHQLRRRAEGRHAAAAAVG